MDETPLDIIDSNVKRIDAEIQDVKHKLTVEMQIAENKIQKLMHSRNQFLLWKKILSHTDTTIID